MWGLLAFQVRQAGHDVTLWCAINLISPYSYSTLAPSLLPRNRCLDDAALAGAEGSAAAEGFGSRQYVGYASVNAALCTRGHCYQIARVCTRLTCGAQYIHYGSESCNRAALWPCTVAAHPGSEVLDPAAAAHQCGVPGLAVPHLCGQPHAAHHSVGDQAAPVVPQEPACGAGGGWG